jgi:hypothetical protein
MNLIISCKVDQLGLFVRSITPMFDTPTQKELVLGSTRIVSTGIFCCGVTSHWWVNCSPGIVCSGPLLTKNSVFRTSVHYVFFSVFETIVLTWSIEFMTTAHLE